ncbi:hypothetical protein H1Q63_18520 [Desmonostoc muscorum CCALA 125]|nr:hypothetical protein [Desmonostoc muscorum CCALA 125]
MHELIYSASSRDKHQYAEPPNDLKPLRNLHLNLYWNNDAWKRLVI